MDKLKISIALCTHNGEKFLAEQLKSFQEQSVLPDEIVICDDASTDNTLKIIENFIANTSIVVKLFKNEKPLKSIKNFEKALSHCSHEIIFLSDQDDVWLPQKIERISNVFKQNKKVRLVFSDALLVNESLASLNKTQLEVLRMGQQQKADWSSGKAVDLMLMGNRITGCTVAVRKQLVERSLPFPTEIPEVLHDAWLGWMAAITNSTYLLDEVLTWYRQHAQQQIGSTKPKLQTARVGLKERLNRPLSEKLAPFQQQAETLALLYQELKEHLPENDLNVVKQKLDFLEMRSRLSSNRFARILPVLSHVVKGDYFRFKDQSVGMKAALLAILGDIFE